MQSYDKKALEARLRKIKKIYCSNDLNFGVKLLPIDYALNHRYIQVNNDKAIMFLVIDLDHNNPIIFEEIGLPAPNFATIDPVKNTSHYCYALSMPIYKDYQENDKALRLFAKIQHAYTKILKGDPLYTGMITKNPLCDYWKVWNINHFYPYDLCELADYVDLPKTINKREAIGEGRNCFLFDAVRKFAYKEVLFYKKNNATESDFYNLILDKLQKSNVFTNSLPLEFNELKNLAKSISKWTWLNFSIEKFSEIQSHRGRKGGKKSGEKRNIEKLKLMEKFSNEFS